MAEKYELDRWAAVVCNGFTAVNVMSSGNVEELGWDYTEMELDPTGTCGLFDGMLLDWDDDPSPIPCITPWVSMWTWGLLFTIAAPATITVSVAVRRLTA